MPDPARLLEDGTRYQLGGALDSALECYRAVEQTGATPALVAEAYRRESSVHRARCDWDAALATARESARIAAQHGLADLLAEARNAEAAVYQSRGDFEVAIPILRDVLTGTGDERVRGVALQNLGTICALRGDHDAAERLFLDSYRSFSRASYSRGQAIALNNYGRAALEKGEPAIATRIFAEAIGAARREGDLELVAIATLNSAEAYEASGDHERASDEVAAALGYFLAVGNAFRQAECYRLMGDVSRTLGRREVAERCYTMGLELAASIGAQVEEAQLRERVDALAGDPPASGVAAEP